VNEEYVYKGQNLTALILMKIEQIVGIIAEKENRSFKDCYRDFLLSRAYRNLTDTDTLLWGESDEFIIDDFQREKETAEVTDTVFPPC
jgi:hypothetical protein